MVYRLAARTFASRGRPMLPLRLSETRRVGTPAVVGAVEVDVLISATEEIWRHEAERGPREVGFADAHDEWIAEQPHAIFGRLRRVVIITVIRPLAVSGPR